MTMNRCGCCFLVCFILVVFGVGRIGHHAIVVVAADDDSSSSHCTPATDQVQNSEGVCVSRFHPNNESSAVAAAGPDDDTCPIWSFGGDWVLAGRPIRRKEMVPGLFPDIMIPWQQHSTRAFPRWSRHHYFFRNPTSSSSSEMNQFIFAPGYRYPVACHDVYANLDVNYTDVFSSAFASSSSSSSSMLSNPNQVRLNPHIRTDRAIAMGDPLFLPCIDPTLSSRAIYSKFPSLDWTTEELEESAEVCLDMAGIYVDTMKSEETTGRTNEYGTFASRRIEKGVSITWGLFLPIHRTELHDRTSNQDELLINYCYTPDRDGYTSSLLLLPIAPGANTINHANRTKHQKPNVAIVWMDPKFRPEEFFQAPTELLFGIREWRDRKHTLMVEYVALRDIAPGEELLLDYGDDWQVAWEAHVLQQQQQPGAHSVFRHPIGLPNHMIPTKWLSKESILTQFSYREWHLPKLDAGELQRMQLSDAVDDSNTVKIKDTRQINGMVDRVGLPIGLSEYMAQWADEMGITKVLRAHVRGELTLPPEGERRLRLNGTTWWVKRFPLNWRSDMHYISPDDFGSNQMFMQALADAGFDTVLNAVGKRDNLTSITVYYPSFIAVSHCTSALMHNDSEEDGHYNVIFPVMQVNNSRPELIVGDDTNNLYAPYKYEPDHAVVLGKLGLHGTAPCDYRGTDSMRMVVSVYMLDGDNIATRDKVLEEWRTSDPPYPLIPDRLKFIERTKHWKRDDASRNLRNPLVSEQTLEKEEIE